VQERTVACWYSQPSEKETEQVDNMMGNRNSHAKKWLF